MNRNGNIQVFLGCDKPYGEADIVIYGAPFDSTTSYRPGARFGPAAVRGESGGIETYSLYQDRDLGDLRIYDSGDLELPFGSAEEALAAIAACAGEILADEKIPFMVGGEHLVSLGAVRAAAAKYPDLHIVHLDAHADLRDRYLGQKLSHATVMRRIHDILGDGRIHQFGIRSGDRGEIEWGKGRVETVRFGFDGLDRVIGSLREKPVYLTVDLDVLDPSAFPGTGTPEAGGAGFRELLQAVTDIAGGLRIIGADMVELSPHYDPSGVSTAAACKIMREMLLAIGG